MHIIGWNKNKHKWIKSLWAYPDKKYGFCMLGYEGKKDILYLRKSKNGNIFLHVGSYTAGYMNTNVLDDRTIKYLFLDDLPDFKYLTNGIWHKNNMMKNDKYIRVEEK